MIDGNRIKQLKEECRYDELYEYVMNHIIEGDPEASYQYARMCHYGEGVDEDMMLAIFYYKKAIQKGHEQAKKDLANYFYDLGNYSYQYALQYKNINHSYFDLKALKLFNDAINKYKLALSYDHEYAEEKMIEVLKIIQDFKKSEN